VNKRMYVFVVTLSTSSQVHTHSTW